MSNVFQLRWQIYALKELYLPNNMLRGHLPPFGDRPPLGRPFPLAYIDLSDNELDGHILPMLLMTFLKLQNVILRNNQLNDSIPSPTTKLHYLTDLNLSHNALTGKIPPSIGLLSSLELLDLSNSKLEGAIPLNDSNLSKLWRLFYTPTG